jgi:tetratricopeptide (TPR) repeat protein
MKRSKKNHVSRSKPAWEKYPSVRISRARGRGDYATALRITNRMLSILPKDPYYLEERAATYVSMGKWKEAVKDYDSLLKEYDSELSSYHRGAEMPLNFLFNMARRAEALLNWGKNKIIIEEFDELEERGLLINELIRIRSKAFYQLGKFPKSIRDLKHLSSIDEVPLYKLSVHYDLHLNYLKQEEYEKAIDEITECIRIKPRYPRYYMLRSRILVQLGRIQDAIIDMIRCLIADSSNQVSLKYAFQAIPIDLEGKRQKSLGVVFSLFKGDLKKADEKLKFPKNPIKIRIDKQMLPRSSAYEPKNKRIKFLVEDKLREMREKKPMTSKESAMREVANETHNTFENINRLYYYRSKQILNTA